MRLAATSDGEAKSSIVVDLAVQSQRNSAMNSVEQSHCSLVVDGVGTSLLQTSHASISFWHDLGASAVAFRQSVIISVCEILVGGETLVST